MKDTKPAPWRLPKEAYRRAGTSVAKTRNALAMAAMALLGLGTFLGGMLRTAIYGATNVFDFVNDPIGSFMVVGGLLILVIFGLLLASRAIPAHPKAIGGMIAVVAVLLIGGFVLAQVAIVPGSVVPPATGSSAAVASYIVASGNGAGNTVPGCSLNAGSTVMTCDVDFNYTGNFFYACSGNLTAGTARTACVAHNYLLIGIHSARTDVLNSTYGFPFAVASVPTVTTAGTSPTVYSPAVGYTVATGTSPGVWQSYWSAGSTANLKPANQAPQSTSGFTATSLGIGAFAGATDVLHVSLPGSNSTFAPTWPTTGTAGSSNTGLTLYSSYSMTISIGNSNPTALTVTIVLIGFTT